MNKIWQFQSIKPSFQYQLRITVAKDSILKTLKPLPSLWKRQNASFRASGFGNWSSGSAAEAAQQIGKDQYILLEHSKKGVSINFNFCQVRWFG
nr:hypothetical protein [uncultured Desulfobacter sp.]